ncbi:MAG TPA: hypothetical protein VMK65_10840 [Longimicrobiales bacterium]|nr:hypothetical protein [Longimicrobiales bacterium]
MSRLNVLVVSPRASTATWLADRLDPNRFLVSLARPGPRLVESIRARRPDLAVLDEIHARPGVAQMEVALLKDQRPDVQIIALSDDSSERDGDVVEQGIFCYLGGCSLDELLRVIQAAAQDRDTRCAFDPNDNYELRSRT